MSKDKLGAAGKHRNGRGFSVLLFALLLLTVAVVTMVGAYRALLRHARAMGEELVESYAADEERNIAVYQTLVQMGMFYLDELVGEPLSGEEKQANMLHYLERMKASARIDAVECYALLDDQLLTTRALDISESYDYHQQDWYRQAIGAGGRVIYTESYTDEFDGRQLVSVASVDPATGNGVLIDLDAACMEEMHDDLNLMRDGAYYVFDANGTLLFSRTSFSTDAQDFEAYTAELFRQVRQGAFDNGETTIRDLNDDKRGVYLFEMSNGWTCVLTVPYSGLLGGLGDTVVWLAAVFCTFSLIMLILWYRDQHLGRVAARTRSTLDIMGSAYYATYRLNLRQARYERIKGSAEVKQLIGDKGTYQEMLDAFVAVLDDDAAAEFRKGFELEHVRALARKHTQEYGGDFYRLVDGEYRWVNASLIFAPEGDGMDAVFCFRQIDREKQAQLNHIKLLETSLDAADASERAQRQFFANMSHDLRTPLNIILGMADLARREQCTPEQRQEYLQNIQSTGKQMLGLVNDILEISRLEQGKVSLERKSIDLPHELAACVAPFQQQAKEQSKRFELDMQVEQPIVLGDPLRLNQIFSNLLSNAMKFTSSGDLIRVTLRQVSGRSKSYIFVVEDTGIGMSPAFLPHLFEPYAQENRFASSVTRGSGLGMPIVKNLVTQKGGKIAVESTPGKGTKFTVTLPFLPAEQTEQTKETPVGEDCLKGRRILVVEDNELNREITGELLRQEGAIVTEAVDGQDAWEQFQRSAPESFDAILMDLQMPRMDGCEAAKAIRALDRPDAKNVIIVALTANAFSEDVSRSLQVGMNAHLSKPVDLDMIRKTLSQLWGRK